jgi:hypothetical protein
MMDRRAIQRWRYLQSVRLLQGFARARMRESLLRLPRQIGRPPAEVVMRPRRAATAPTSVPAHSPTPAPPPVRAQAQPLPQGGVIKTGMGTQAVAVWRREHRRARWGREAVAWARARVLSNWFQNSRPCSRVAVFKDGVFAPCRST